jgi:hypothetical protein
MLTKTKTNTFQSCKFQFVKYNPSFESEPSQLEW